MSGPKPAGKKEHQAGTVWENSVELKSPTGSRHLRGAKRMMAYSVSKIEVKTTETAQIHRLRQLC